MDSHLSPFSFLNISSSSVRLFPASSSLLAEIDRTQHSSIFAVYSQYIYSILSVYSQHILSIFSVYSQYIHSIFSTYSQHIISIFSVYLQYTISILKYILSIFSVYLQYSFSMLQSTNVEYQPVLASSLGSPHEIKSWQLVLISGFFSSLTCSHVELSLTYPNGTLTPNSFTSLSGLPSASSISGLMSAVREGTWKMCAWDLKKTSDDFFQ